MNQSACTRTPQILGWPRDQWDADVERHVEQCAECRAAWNAHNQLLSVAQQLPAPVLSPDRIALLTARLIVAAEAEDVAAAATTTAEGVNLAPRTPWTTPARPFQAIGRLTPPIGMAALPLLDENDATDDISFQPPPRRSARVAAGWLVLAAALLLGSVALWRTLPPQPANELLRGEVHGAAAEFAVVGNQPNEIVRLYDGTITVEVDDLQPGERFRVVTGDAEVEVHGTVFDVVVENDRLVAVRVVEGEVAVRHAATPEVRLDPGERWSAPDPASARASRPAEPEEVPAPPLALAPVDDGATGTPIDALALDPFSPSFSAGAGAWGLFAPATTGVPTISGRPPVPARTPGPGNGSAQSGTSARAGAPPVGFSAPVAAVAPAPGPNPTVAPAPAAPAPSASVAALPPGSPDEEAFREAWDLLETGRPRAAAERFGRVSSDSELAEDALYWRGVALTRAGESSEAMASFRQFIRSHPGASRRAEAALALGLLLANAGDTTAATRAFRDAAERGSGTTRTRALEALESLGADAER